MNEEVYTVPMKEYELSEVNMVRKPLEVIEKESPSYVIGYSKELISLFLEALKLHDDLVTKQVISLLSLLQVNPESKREMTEKIVKAKAVDQKHFQGINPSQDIG